MRCGHWTTTSLQNQQNNVINGFLNKYLFLKSCNVIRCNILLYHNQSSTYRNIDSGCQSIFIAFYFLDPLKGV